MSENNQTKSNIPKESNAGRGGRRAGSGRKKGAATTKTREIADKAAEEGITPLEFMLQIMRNEPDAELPAEAKLSANAMRFEAAKAAAPYIHPKLSAVEHTGKDGGPMETVTRVELVAMDGDSTD